MSNLITSFLRGLVSNMTQPPTQQVYSNTLQLVTGTPVALDFKTLQNNLKLDNIQGVWIDNSQNSSPAQLTVQATLQNFTVPAGYQGVAPLYVTADLVVIVSGNGNLPMVFLNFPTPAAVWPAAGGGTQTFTGGNLNTRDTNIALAMDQSGVGVVEKAYGNADQIVRRRLGAALSGQVTAAGNTVLLAGAPSVFLSSADISVDGNASLAAAGSLTVTLSFGTSALQILKRTIVLPNAAPATPSPRYELFNQSDLSFIGALAADNLTMNLSAALTSGGVQYTLGAGTTGVQ